MLSDNDIQGIAKFLLMMGPYSFLLKTIVFAVLGILLIRQGAVTSVGKWLIFLFFATALISSNLTDLMFYLDMIATGGDIDTFREWKLVIMDAIWSLVVSGAGIGVMIAQRHEERKAKRRMEDESNRRAIEEFRARQAEEFRNRQEGASAS